MKTTFKSIFVAAALLVSGSAFAQEAGTVKFGVQAGANLSNFAGDLDDLDDLDAKVGFQVGVTADYFLSQNLFLQSGLAYTTKGAKKEVLGVKTTMNLNYLQLPVRIGYAIPVSEGFSVNLNAGPYVAYGIGGKTKVGDLKSDSFGDDGLKEFDFGIGGGVGAEFGAIAINLGYEYGLADLGSDNIKVNNVNAYLTLGYKF